MIEPHTLLIESAPGNRLALVHEALRDLGLEPCSKCQIWKGPDRMGWVGADTDAGSFTSAICHICFSPSPPEGEGWRDSAGVRVSPDPTNAAATLRQAIAQVAQADAPCSAWAR